MPEIHASHHLEEAQKIVGEAGESNRLQPWTDTMLYEGFRLRLFERRYSDDESPYEGIESPPAATVVICRQNPQGDALFLITEESVPLTDERRYPAGQHAQRGIRTVNKGTLFKFPGGMCHPSDDVSPADTIIREVQEEVGLTIKEDDLVHLGAPFYYSQRCASRDTIFLVNLDANFIVGETKRESTEDIRTYWLSWLQICALINAQDPRTQNAQFLDIIGLISARMALDTWPKPNQQ